MNDYSINAVITLDTSDYKKGISEAQKSTKTFSSNFSKLTKGLGGALLKGGAIGLGITAVTKGLQALSKTVKESIKVWEDASAQQKKLGQTLKATGADAWTTAEELNAMADAYQKATNYSSDEITKMQTVLLGFKNVSQDTFQSASDAILDMAEVMGMDLVSATQTVGKALDDPINGLGSLSRQGFKFSEAEKELIKNLVEAGESAKAQKIILDELNTTYGGASKAGVKASIQLKNAWKDVVKELGRGITLNIDVGPAIQKLQKLIDDFKRVMQENNDATELTDKLIEAEKAIEQKTATDEQVILVYENKIKLMEQEYRQYEGLLGIEDEYAREGIARLDEEKKHYEWQIENAKKRIEFYKYLDELAEERKNKALEEENYEANIAKIKQEHLDKIAEQVAQWERIKQVTGEEVSLEEKLKFYQDDLVSILQEANGGITKQNQYYKDQIAIIQKLQGEIALKDVNKNKKGVSDVWTQNLREQAIERLETEKETYMQSEAFLKMSLEEKYNFEKKYNDQLFQLNLERIQDERANALKSVEGVENEEEEKARIIEYYQNEIIKNAKNFSTAYEKETKKTLGDIVKEWTSSFKTIVSKMGTMASKLKDPLQKLTKTFMGIFKKINLKSLFEFNPDTALDGLLVFEDKVLTFFVETMPKLPQFFKSALQSISVLLKTIKLNIDQDKVRDMMKELMQTMGEFLPDIIGTGLEIARCIILGITEGIQQNIGIIMQVLDVIVDVASDVLPDIMGAILDVITSLIENLDEGTIIKVVDAIIKLFVKIATAIISNASTIASKLIPALFEILLQLFKEFPNILKTVLWEVIKGMGKIATSLWNGIKKLFGWEHGTNSAPKGLALVGETGPELVDFKGGERVINNNNTQKLLADAGKSGASVFNITFENTQDTTAYAMMKQLKQYQRNLAFNGVL